MVEKHYNIANETVNSSVAFYHIRGGKGEVIIILLPIPYTTLFCIASYLAST
jgi:hypothetical protein